VDSSSDSHDIRHIAGGKLRPGKKGDITNGLTLVSSMRVRLASDDSDASDAKSCVHPDAFAARSRL